MICVFEFIWIWVEFVVFSRLDFDDSGECDPSVDLEYQDFNEGKLHFDHIVPTILKYLISVLNYECMLTFIKLFKVPV